MITKPSKIRPLFMQCSIYFFILHLLLQFSLNTYIGSSSRICRETDSASPISAISSMSEVPP